MKTAIFVITLIVILTISFGAGYTIAAQQQEITQLEQDIVVLKDHNLRLLKNLEFARGQENEAIVLAANTEDGNKQMVTAITETQNWLRMAEMAVDELDRVARENDNMSYNVPIIVKDLRDVIREANSELGQALGTDLAQDPQGGEKLVRGLRRGPDRS